MRCWTPSVLQYTACEKRPHKMPMKFEDDMTSLNLKAETFRTLAWIGVFPFLAAWPFLSAFPAFSLMGASSFDLTTSLNLVFLMTGFWPAAGALLVIWVLLRTEARTQARIILSGKGLFIGIYAGLWTGVYMIASVVNR
jgi:hypothetical protein